MYVEFRNYFEVFPIISLVEIHKAFPNFDRRRLVEWQHKGYIEKIRQGYYRFKNQSLNENGLYLCANKIYAPSYISLESALAYYQIIPESVFTITSITSRNTAQFTADCGKFKYQNVKSDLFFGYRLIRTESFSIQFASVEKAILDYLYLHPELKNRDDFEALRWNAEILKKLDFQLFSDYLHVFSSKSLTKRFQILLKYIHD